MNMQMPQLLERAKAVSLLEKLVDGKETLNQNSVKTNMNNLAIDQVNLKQVVNQILLLELNNACNGKLKLLVRIIKNASL